MNITTQRADLARALAAVSRVVSTRNTIPILANVLLSADSGRLSITATDLDISYTTSVPCEGEPGSTTVEARRMGDIVKRMAGDTVSLSIKDDNLIAKSGRSRFTLATLPVADFPLLDAGQFDVEFDVDFAALVAPVRFAISNEPTRYYLCGVYLHSAPEGLRAVATDGHRLSHNTVAPVGDIPAVIVPKKTVGIVPDGKVHVSLSKNKVRFATDDSVIVSKLIDGSFPDYTRVIPQNADKTVEVDRKEFAASVARAAAVEDVRGRAAKFTIANDNIAIDMRDGANAAREDIPVEYSGEPIEVGFNSAYIADILSAVPGERVRISFADPGSPAIFRGDGDVLAVCMPMRVAA